MILYAKSSSPALGQSILQTKGFVSVLNGPVQKMTPLYVIFSYLSKCSIKAKGSLSDIIYMSLPISRSLVIAIWLII